MHTEQQWLKDDLEREETEGKERYKWFMRPEPRDAASEVLLDESNGLKYRWFHVGMTRNAKAENKRKMKVYLEPLPHTIIKDAKKLQGWYKNKHEPANVRPRPCFTDAMLTEPYGGFCTVGCMFCYVNSGVRGYRGSGIITVPENYGDQIANQLSKLKKGMAGYFSSFTDPFLEIEKIYHNSQRGAEAFVNAGLPIFFLSRLQYPGWAFDLMSKSPYSYAQKSINTPDPKVWKKLSPNALPLLDHLDEIRELSKRGIYVSIQCNPIMPSVVTHDDVEHLFEMLADAGADHVIIKFVEAGYSWAPAMVKRIARKFGKEHGERFGNLFTQNIGGQKTIEESYRMEGHRRYRAKATNLGMTYATCYEFKYARDGISGNIINKTGVSVGREFTTADQCHGHRVPMFTRDTFTEQFQPMDICPPSGCLYCADEHNMQPLCGDELLGQAKALRFGDLKSGVGGTFPANSIQLNIINN